MKYQHFSIEERERLQLLWWERGSVRSIAKALNRSPSSISRELSRNFPARDQRYTPRLAHERAIQHRSHRGREQRLKNDEIREYVVSHLKLNWSPEQIAGRMKIDLPDQSISHEAIYQFIYHRVNREGRRYIDAGEDLRIYLRRKRKRRLKKGARRGQRVLPKHGLSIDLRPEIVNQRARIGDWESDSVESIDHKPGINTLVERKTGLTFITKLKAKTSAATAEAISDRISPLPEELKQTMTFDNGPENQQTDEIEKQTGLICFFAHAYHSWERGTNENTNGLIREYFPKKTDFDMISETEIQKVEYLLNTRPRKRLGYRTPLETLSVALES